MRPENEIEPEKKVDGSSSSEAKPGKEVEAEALSRRIYCQVWRPECFPPYGRPSARVPDFTIEGLKELCKHDTNNDGVLQKKELEAAQDEPHNRKGQIVHDLLLSNYDQLTKMSKDGKDGISAADLIKVRELKDDISAARELELNYGNRFDFRRLDRDRDNFVSKQEIEERMQNTYGSERESLEFMLDNYKTIAKSSNDEFGIENNGISRSDIVSYADKLAGSEAGQMVDDLQHEMLQAVEFWGGGYPPLPIHRPRPVELPELPFPDRRPFPMPRPIPMPKPGLTPRPVPEIPEGLKPFPGWKPMPLPGISYGDETLWNQSRPEQLK